MAKLNKLVRPIAGGLLAAGLVFGAAETANAAVLFSQDFESGLSANESTSGNFSINNTNAANNGTLMMGHPGTYSDGAYDFYQISNLIVGAGGVLEFDYVLNHEFHFDGFNLIAALAGTLAPPGGLVTPTAGMIYNDEGHAHRPELGNIVAFSQAGHAIFDLSGFAGNAIDIRFQFGSDGSVVFPGDVFDNVLITDTSSAVPEPTSLGLIGLGLLGLGAMARRRRTTAAC